MASMSKPARSSEDVESDECDRACRFLFSIDCFPPAMGCCMTLSVSEATIQQWINSPDVPPALREALQADYNSRKARGEFTDHIAQTISRAIWRDQVYTRIASSGLVESDQQAVREVYDNLAKSPLHPMHVEKTVGQEIRTRLNNK